MSAYIDTSNIDNGYVKLIFDNKEEKIYINGRLEDFMQNKLDILVDMLLLKHGYRRVSEIEFERDDLYRCEIRQIPV